MIKQYFNIFIFAVFCFTGVFGKNMNDQDIQKKQTQIEKLRKEIDKFEEKIKESSKKEKSSIELLSNFDRQSILLKKLILKLKEREKDLQGEITLTKKTIEELGGQLSSLKQHYAGYVSTVYKFGKTYDLELLLSSKSFNQLLIRSEYLRRFSDQRQKDIVRIDNKKTLMETQHEILGKQLVEQKNILAEKQKEETRLTAKTKKRKTLLVEIRRDKRNYKKEIDRRKQDVKELEQIITKLIEEDRINRTKNEKNVDVPAGTGFLSRRGKLRWPVNQGRVTTRFGSQQHPTLHTVTQNTGIDISVNAGTDVYAVAEGDVSKIHWLPSYGNLLILNHRDGFRTVYAHLSEITVNEGDVVKEGSRIGVSGESITGSIVHFEIYKERDKLDPELWLKQGGVSRR
ncbi:MAG: peptidoglycan DD-metalloendopeptidase family protein [Ignavibacteriales bacterium]|nr:peptidoglycan DD-metalloendopeptidase family protein [Ignavibacteriales bacterium]